MTATVLASAARTASGTAAFPSSLLDALRHVEEAQFLLDVTVAATGILDTLNVYIQSSPDGGTTWDDFVSFTQVLGNGGAKKYIARWSRTPTPEREMGAPQDGALAAGSVLQGSTGYVWRVKWVIVDGGAAAQSFTFSLAVDAVRSRLRG